MSRIDDFLNTIEISQDELEKANRDLFSKGIDIHEDIRDSIYSFRRNKVKYCEIASAYRYDKRMRLVLYKYISYVEEFIRARVVDYFYENKESKIFVLKNKHIRTIEEIYLLNFNKLTQLLMKIPDYEKRCKYSKNAYQQNNIKALVVMRNAVMHNRFLQFYNSYKNCYYNGEKQQATLRYNILNLMQFLPAEAAQKCKDEINKCKNYKNTQDDVKWNLPKEIIIDLNV